MLEHERRWAYSLEPVSDGWERFGTREEAIAAGAAEIMANGHESTFYVGECRFYEPRVHSHQILDYLRYDVESSDWGECSELWLDEVTADEERLLDEMLTETLHEWLRRTGNVPDFSVCNFKEAVLCLG